MDTSKLYWAFPPKALIRVFLDLWRQLRGARQAPEIWALLLLDERAPWFRRELIGDATQLMQWDSGSKMFRVRDSDTGRWRKVGSNLKYIVFSLPAVTS